MEETFISAATRAAMLAVSIVTVFGPVLLLVIWCVRKKASAIPALAGVLVFLVFVRMLEMIPHTFFLLMDNPVSRALRGNAWLYAIYGGLAAGIFEETGRFVAFRFFLKKYPGKESAVTYGIGHGGFEAMSLVGFAFLQYFTIAGMINNGTMNSMISGATGASLESMQAVAATISSMTVGTCLIAIVERLYTIVFHIALSILVFQGVHTGKKWLFPLAILLHALMDLFAGLYQTGMLPLAAVEIIGVAFTVLVSASAWKLYQKNCQEELPYEK